MNTTSDGGNQHGRGLRGDPVDGSGHGDGTRDTAFSEAVEFIKNAVSKQPLPRDVAVQRALSAIFQRLSTSSRVLARAPQEPQGEEKEKNDAR